MSKTKALSPALEEAKAALKEARDYLEHNGIRYDLKKWVTIKKYCDQFDVKPNTVMNWIDRGVIPAGNVIIVKSLNDLKLIKAVPYKETVK